MTDRKPALTFEINGSSVLCRHVRDLGFSDFYHLAQYVQSLPYGRTKSSSDPAIVLNAEKGTCSTKHRLLAAIAHDCGRYDIQLMIGIYAMSQANTPGVGAVLARAGLESIPEAHCYLSHANNRYDFTGLSSGETSPFTSLLAEHRTQPDVLIGWKPILHRQFISQWVVDQKLSAEMIWRIREECIAALAKR